MSATGYINKAGKYVRVQKVPLDQMVIVQQSTYKQADQHQQRFDHAAEIIQPYTYDGQPNPQMIEVDPDAAAQYGFIPPRENIVHDPEAFKPAEGSLPWGQSVS
jgi:hypothetical protein